MMMWVATLFGVAAGAGYLPECPMRLNTSLCEVPRESTKQAPSSKMEGMIYNGHYFPKGSMLVAFASHPHSGNSWLRSVLDSLTNIEIPECDSFVRNRALRSLMVKTHRSPDFRDGCPLFGDVGEDSVLPQAFVHLVRNPVDVAFSLRIVRQAAEFDPDQGYTVDRLWLQRVIKHMKHWATDALSLVVQQEEQAAFPDRMLAFQLRYEDALAEPVLTIKALMKFLWHAHHPNERALPVFSHMPSTEEITDVLQVISCEATGATKCLTGGSDAIGKSAACFNPTQMLESLGPDSAFILRTFGYEIAPEPNCPLCRDNLKTCCSECNCVCPLQLNVKTDRAYSGVVDSQGNIVMTMQQLVDSS